MLLIIFRQESRPGHPPDRGGGGEDMTGVSATPAVQLQYLHINTLPPVFGDNLARVSTPLLSSPLSCPTVQTLNLDSGSWGRGLCQWSDIA